MCFSATASFSSSALLGVVGAIIVTKTKDNRAKALALIPWFFGIQQLFEGILWLHLPGNAHEVMAIYAKNLFLFFAYIFWPVWIPFSLWLVEIEPKRKQILSALLGMGLALAVFLALVIPYTVSFNYKASIIYSFQMPNQTMVLTELFSTVHLASLAIYGLVTLSPLFISSFNKMWVLGVSVTLAAIAILWIDKTCFASLWCFFAAIFSVGLLFLLPFKEIPKKRWWS